MIHFQLDGGQRVRMGNVLKAPIGGFLWTIVSTFIMYILVGLSTLTVVCFILGIVLTVIHFIKDEYRYYERQQHEIVEWNDQNFSSGD